MLFIENHIYIDVDNLKNNFFSKLVHNYFKDQFSWAGKKCNLEDLPKFISNKEYVVKEEEFTKHLNKFCADPNKLGVDLLSEQIKDILNEK